MHQIEIDLEKDKNQTEQILTELAKYDLEGAIVKIIYNLPQDCSDEVDLSLIQKACSNAMQVVGIIPVKKQVRKEYRANLKVDMDLNTILNKYFDSKNLSVEQKNNLLAKAEELSKEEPL